jgi:hypothetical protein
MMSPRPSSDGFSIGYIIYLQAGYYDGADGKDLHVLCHHVEIYIKNISWP